MTDEADRNVHLPDLKKLMEGMPSYQYVSHGFDRKPEGDDALGKVGFVLSFSEKGFGFGEVAVVQSGGVTFVDTEHMDPERVKRYLCQLVDQAITDNDKDPEKHALYNQHMGRSCGEGCSVCYPKTPAP